MNLNFFFLRYETQGRKNSTLVLPHYLLYFLIFHVRFSSPSYISQLVDIFSYEMPINSKKLESNNLNINNYSTASKTVIYHFHNLLNHERLFLFALNIKSSTKFSNLKSITELFPNANWLEREVSELYNFTFEGKKDTRNLMLQYGDNSAPFQKFFPSIGLKEMLYDLLSDLIIQQDLSCQA